LTVREDKIYIHCRVAGHRLLIDVYEYVSDIFITHEGPGKEYQRRGQWTGYKFLGSM